MAMLLATSLAAQAVRGVVVLSDGNTRAAGVIVVAAGDSGQPARALTNTRGEFTIALPHAGTFQLKALRIGFRPTDGPKITVANSETVRAQIQLTDVAVSLIAVRVQGDDVCRTRPDSGALVTRAWEEARKAIMSAGLSATDAPLVAEWIEYNRTLEATGRVVRALRVRTTHSATTHAFKSLPADALVEKGYVIVEGDDISYHAPDGDVLVSDSFAGSHCFQVVLPPGRGADSLIGVAFRPARDQRDIRDIEGTFWLDRRSAELKWMDFKYTNMPSAAEKASPGGRVEFLRLGGGGWLIGNWNIRMPEFGRALASASASAGRMTVVRAPNTTVLRTIQVTGGQVTKVSRGDSVVYQAVGAELDVQVISLDESVSATGTMLELLGTDYVAKAGTDGRVRISPVLEGRYEVRIHSSIMDTLGLPPITREIEIGNRASVDTVRLPPPLEMARAACGGVLGDRTGLIRGTVRDSTGEPIPNAAVLVSWLGSMKIIGGGTADRVGWSEQNVAVLSDAYGRWRSCGVPRGVPFTVTVKTDAGTDARRSRLADDQAMATADLVAHKVATTTDIVLPKENRALVEFWASNSDGTVMPDVTLDLELPGGVKRTINTGPNGHALLGDVAPGQVTVRARKVGFLPGKLLATVGVGRNTVPITMSPTGLPTLATVRIVGDQRKTYDRFDEFETRHLNSAATRSITRAEIEKRNPVDAWQMLTNVPSVKIAQLGGVIIARSMRVENAGLLSDAPCYMKVMVDGVLMAETESVGKDTDKTIKTTFANLANLPPPDQIRGIEVFAGPASIPVQYGGTGNGKWCGLIAVWTR